MRVPTYSNYLTMSAAIQNNKSLVDKYSFQSVSGLKHMNYSGYGMSAYNIVSMESTLNITNTFMENNKLANIELKTSNLAIETITDAMADIKTALTDLQGTDLSRISPDYTGGELTFTDDDMTVYDGKTLTIGGSTYTFVTDPADTEDSHINISAFTSAKEVMQAVADKAKTSGVEFNGKKLTFPLYTINGASTLLTEEPAKSAVTTGEPHTMSNEQALALENLQNLAFSTMQLVADTLNTNVNGKYLYGGGSSTAPINFNFSSLEEFQNYYDGINTRYPSSTSAVLSNFSVDASSTGDIEFSYDDANDRGVIKATGGSFLKEAMIMNAANTGSVTFDSAANTMTATEYGAYSLLNPGDTIVINGNNAALGNNAKAYIIESVSADGRTVTFAETTPVAETTDPDNPLVPNGDITINSTFSVGSVISLDGFNNNNLATGATVTGISDDGTELYVQVDSKRFPNTSSTGNNRWAISAKSYYQGGDLDYNQRISESQTISFDVKASDPAFEKIFRALGQIAQGNLVDTSNPLETGNLNTEKTLTLVEDALKLVSSATSGAGDISNAKNASLYSITAKLNADYTVLNKVTENQQLAASNLETNIGTLKDANKEEAALKLLLAESSLEASYTVLSSVSSLSLLNYMK